LPTEATVRDALSAHLLARRATAERVLAELWVPRSNERADLALLGRTMDGFEIKTERDTLRRLPRQVSAYGRLFDTCTAVVAEKHLRNAEAIVPDWWGITTVVVNGHVSFKAVRAPKHNPGLDPEILVRLLWRDEAMTALVLLGAEPDPKAHRTSLWRELLTLATLPQLRSAVRQALVTRDRANARIPMRRTPRALTAAVAHL
jgi:hypothetical protein